MLRVIAGWDLLSSLFLLPPLSMLSAVLPCSLVYLLIQFFFVDTEYQYALCSVQNAHWNALDILYFVQVLEQLTVRGEGVENDEGKDGKHLFVSEVTALKSCEKQRSKID